MASRDSGEPIVSEAWLDALTTSCDTNAAYGYLWWLNGKKSVARPGANSIAETPYGMTPSAPADMVTAAGAFDQKLYTYVPYAIAARFHHYHR